MCAVVTHHAFPSLPKEGANGHPLDICLYVLGPTVYTLFHSIKIVITGNNYGIITMETGLLYVPESFFKTLKLGLNHSHPLPQISSTCNKNILCP